MPRPHRAEVLSDDAGLTSVTYNGPKSRTERPRKTKIGTEIGHVTRDSDTTFKVKGQLARAGAILWRPPAQLVDNIIDQRRRRLHACLQATTGYFEYSLCHELVKTYYR